MATGNITNSGVGSFNNAGTIKGSVYIGVDAKPVLAKVEEACAKVCQCIESQGVVIVDEVKQALPSLILDRITPEILCIKDSVQSSAESIRQEVQRNVRILSDKMDGFVDDIVLELRSIKDLKKSLGIDALQSLLAESAYAAKEAYQSVVALMSRLEDRLPNHEEELNIAWDFLHSADFTNAEKYFNMALSQNNLRSEAFFGLSLTEKKIQLIFDPVQKSEQPIIHDSCIEPLRESKHFQYCIQCAAEEQKIRYNAIAASVEKILYWFKQYETRGLQYDCFICAKITGENESVTEDGKWIQESALYEGLNRNGIPTFYSEKDCNKLEKGTIQYEALILYALSKVKCMVLVCSKKDYLTTPWVKNEYTRFIRFLRNRKQDMGQIIIVYDKDPIKLPGGIRENYQDISRNGYYEWGEVQQQRWLSDLSDAVRQRVERGKGYVDCYKKYCPKCGKEYGDLESDICSRSECGAVWLVSAFEFANIKLQRETEERIRLERLLEKEKKVSEQKNKAIVALSDELIKLKQNAELANQKIDILGGYSKTIYVENEIISSGETTEINIPFGVTTIDDYAFSGAEDVTSIKIPNSVTHIGKGAFEDCSGLDRIEIPNSVTDIGIGAFSRCYWLHIIVEAGNTKYHSSGDCLIETQSKTLIAGFEFSKIPSDGSVTRIGDLAFAGNDLSVFIPRSIEYISDSAFEDCDDITFFCEASQKPSGWGDEWDDDEFPVIWGASREDISNK